MNYVLCIMTLCLVLSVHCVPRRAGRSPFVECVTDNECANDECCVINICMSGNGKYTSCSKRLQQNDECRPPSDKSVNITIITPDDQLVPVYAHEYLCPCGLNLVCPTITHQCVVAYN